MDADGRRFHLLLGQADWSALVPDTGEAALHWDARRQAAGLPPVIQQLSATPGEALLVPANRRAAAADAFGNIYAISDDLLGLDVTSAGSRATTHFWPVATEPGAGDLFTPAAAAPIAAPGKFVALCVLEGAWLLAARADQGTGLALLLFDLLGGGGPLEQELDLGIVGEAVELAPLADGGFALLDRAARRLWRFDRTLALLGVTETTPEPELFQPVSGEPRESRPAATYPGLDLAPFAADPLALAVWDDHLLLLDGSGDVHAIAADDSHYRLAGTGPGAHALLVARVTTVEDPAAERLLVVRANGNQAFGWRLPASWGEEAEASSELFPLRRFGGRALVSVRGFARYDSVERAWIPLVEKPLRRFATVASGTAPRMDCGVPGTVWDRVVIDGCIPPGTLVEIFARGYDDPDLTPVFASQPRPLLASGRVDLVWHADRALPETDAALGKGSHSLLLQGIRGRYLELRLRLYSDGSASPHLHALRAWSPRVSWVDQHLPAIYRAEPTGFLDRFLANFEGEYRMIEERVGGMQHLFDPATAPADMLAWLADWFDTALDPSWDEARRRLFIAHAETFFRWRGTRRGLLLALRLAFDPCVDARLFDDPEGAGAGGIRIVENFLARTLGSTVAGDPGGALLALPVGERWQVSEGNAGLAARLLGDAAEDAFTPGDQVALYDQPALAQLLGFVPSGAAERARWRAFQLSAGRGDGALVDLPADATDDALWPSFLALASLDRTRWQQFLEGRYRRIGRLNEAHGTQWARFDDIALADHLPETPAAQADWLDFERKVLPAAAAAHRFTVLLPLASVNADPDGGLRDLRLAQRIVALEKPAHTSFSVRFFWAMNRIGEARLGSDTLLGQGSRAPELLPEAVLGRAYLGASFIGPDGPAPTADRRRLAC